MITLTSLKRQRYTHLYILFIFFLTIIHDIHAQSDWTLQNSGTEKSFFAVTWTGGVFIAAGEGVIAYSQDAKNWNHVNVESITGDTAITFREIIPPVEGKDIIALGYKHVLTSPDGITWTDHSQPSSAYIVEVIWGGNKFIGAGDVLFTSTDGINWTEIELPQDSISFIRDIAWSGSLFVGVADYCYIFTSPDGNNWNIYFGNRVPELATVTWTGSKFYAFEQAPGWGIASSTDGVTWSAPIPLPDKNLKNNSINSSTKKRDGPYGKICWTGKELIYLCLKIYTSPDGITWTTQNSIGPGAKCDITWNDSIFVAVGEKGKIMTSPRDNVGISQKINTVNNSRNISLRVTARRLYASIPPLLKNRNISVSIYDISGKKIFKQSSFAADSRIKCSIENLAFGRYTFVVTGGGMQFMKTFCIMH